MLLEALPEQTPHMVINLSAMLTTMKSATAFRFDECVAAEAYKFKLDMLLRRRQVVWILECGAPACRELIMRLQETSQCISLQSSPPETTAAQTSLGPPTACCKSIALAMHHNT